MHRPSTWMAFAGQVILLSHDHWAMLHRLPDRGQPHDKATTHRCGIARGSPEDIWLQLAQRPLLQLNLGVLPQPGLMRQALALCVSLQQQMSFVRQVMLLLLWARIFELFLCAAKITA